MPKSQIIKYALANALWTVLYVILVATFMSNGEAIFGHRPGIIVPVCLLLLFVFSATVCGALFLGRPVTWYLDGKKSDAVRLFAYTLVTFLVTAAIIFVLLWIFA